MALFLSRGLPTRICASYDEVCWLQSERADSSSPENIAQQILAHLNDESP